MTVFGPVNFYAKPSPVSACMDDCLWTGKPPWCTTRHPALLSLSHPIVGRQQRKRWCTNDWLAKQAANIWQRH